MRSISAPSLLSPAFLALVLAAPILAAPALAEPGLPDEAAVAAALDAHPGVQAAIARVTSAGAEARALARGTHEFTVSGSYVRRSVDGEGRFDEYDVQLSRPIRLPGKAALDRRIGEYGLDAARNLAADARHQAALGLAQRWWDWLGAAGEAVVDRQSVANHEKLLAAVRSRVARRDAAVLDADQAEAALGAARLAAEQSAGRERLALARLAAQYPALPLPAEAPEVPQPAMSEAEMTRIHALVTADSHEIAAAAAAARRAGAQAGRARADRVADPSIGFRAFSERGGMERGGGLLFSMPLGGGHRQALSDQAEAQASAARAEEIAARLNVREVADGDVAEAQYRQSAWRRAREGLDAQVAALLKLRRGHAAGEIDFADLLYGERQVHDAFRVEAMARADAMRALTKLRIDSHELWLADSESPAVP